MEGKECDPAVTLVESSPKGEPQPNSIAKREVQDLEGAGTQKLDLEAKLEMFVGDRASLHCVSVGESV